MGKKRLTRTDALPCPFCGEPPEHLGAAHFHHIECHSRQCPVRPQLCEASEHHAVEVWNRRAYSTQELELGRNALVAIVNMQKHAQSLGYANIKEAMDALGQLKVAIMMAVED